MSRGEWFYPKADTPVRDEVLTALADAPARLSADDAQRALASTGRDAGSVSSLGVGTFHELYLARHGAEHVVLKAARLPEPSDDGLAVEAAVTRLLGRHGIPSVAVLSVDLSRTAVPFDFAVLEEATGVSLRSLDADDDAVRPGIAALARHLRRIHEVPMAGWGLLDVRDGVLAGTRASWSDYLGLRSDEHRSHLRGTGALDPATDSEVAAVLDRVRSLPEPATPSLLHGDPGPHNTFLDGGDVRMLDWEDALGGDPMFEVALWATFQPPRRWPAFFAAYFDEDWSPDFRFWAYFLRVSLAKAVVRSRFGYREIPGREPASARIPRALRAIAELPD